MIISLHSGNFITPLRELTNTRMAHWKYAADCSTFPSALMPGMRLRISAVNKDAGDMWVQVAIPYTDPEKSIKISGEEFALNFKSL